MNRVIPFGVIVCVLLGASGCASSQVAEEDALGLVLLERTPACTYSQLHMETTEVGRWVSMNETMNRRSFRRDVFSRARNVPAELGAPNAVILTPMGSQGTLTTVRLLYINADPTCLGATPSFR